MLIIIEKAPHRSVWLHDFLHKWVKTKKSVSMREMTYDAEMRETTYF